MENGFFAAFRATWQAILGDKAVLLVMIGAVLLYSFFYPMGYREQVAHLIPVVVVDQDNSALSRQLLRNIDAVSAVQIIAAANSVQAAQTYIVQGKAHAVVWISPGFSDAIYQGRQGQLALLADGAYLSRASTVLTGLSDAVSTFAKEAAVQQAGFAGSSAAPVLQLVQRPLFNTREGYGSAIVPGVAILIIQQTLLIGMAVMAGTRREQYGRLRYPLVPLTGIAAACILLGMMNLLYYTGFMFWFQDYPRAGSLVAMLALGVLFITAVVSFGLFIGSFFRTRERAYQLITITSLPLFFLSGLSWPASAIADPLGWLAALLPSSAGIIGMVKLNQMGAHWHEVSGEAANLLVLIALYGSLALWRYR